MVSEEYSVTIMKWRGVFKGGLIQRLKFLLTVPKLGNEFKGHTVNMSIIWKVC